MDFNSNKKITGAMHSSLIFAHSIKCMTKKLIPFLLAITLFFVACNNNDNVAKNVNTLPAEEQKLRDNISQHPDSLIFAENLIQYFRDKSLYDDAIKAADEAIKHHRPLARLWDIKAILYFEKGDTTNAVKSYETAIGITPDPQYIMSLGSLYAQSRNPKALEVADALLRQPQSKAANQAYFIKGMYYNFSGEKLKAIPYFDTCLNIDYTNTLAYREKAICLYDLGKYEQSLKELEKAVAVQNTFDEGYYWMGRCYEKMGNAKQAAISYETALQIDPDYTEAEDGLKRIGAK